MKNKGIAKAQWINPLPLCEISEALHLALPGLMAGWLAADRQAGRQVGRQNLGKF